MKHTLFLCILLAGRMACGQEVHGRQAVAPVNTPPMVEMTHEETMVRTAYAKFAYASEQGAIMQLALEGSGIAGVAKPSGLSSDQRESDAEVVFKLSDFKVGSLTDIVNRKATDIISPPVSEMLAAQTPEYAYLEAGYQTVLYYLVPHWVPATPIAPDAISATLGELHQLEWSNAIPATAWDRYASYSVVVTFQGKSRGPYKALFVFGHDAKGGEMVMPEDGNTDSLALAHVLSVQLFPEVFVRSKLRGQPVVANWLSAKQKSGSACSEGRGDVCCDLIQLQCGPGSSDVVAGLAKPLPTLQKP